MDDIKFRAIDTPQTTAGSAGSNTGYNANFAQDTITVKSSNSTDLVGTIIACATKSNQTEITDVYVDVPFYLKITVQNNNANTVDDVTVTLPDLENMDFNDATIEYFVGNDTTSGTNFSVDADGSIQIGNELSGTPISLATTQTLTIWIRVTPTTAV